MVGMSISAQFSRSHSLLICPTSLIARDLGERLGDNALVENHGVQITLVQESPLPAAMLMIALDRLSSSPACS